MNQRTKRRKEARDAAKNFYDAVMLELMFAIVDCIDPAQDMKGQTACLGQHWQEAEQKLGREIPFVYMYNKKTEHAMRYGRGIKILRSDWVETEGENHEG